MNDEGAKPVPHDVPFRIAGFSKNVEVGGRALRTEILAQETITPDDALRLGGAYVFYRATNIAVREEIGRIRLDDPVEAAKYGYKHIDPKRGEFEKALFNAMTPNRETGLVDYKGLKTLLERGASVLMQEAKRGLLVMGMLPEVYQSWEEQKLFAEKLKRMGEILPEQGVQKFVPPPIDSPIPR